MEGLRPLALGELLDAAIRIYRSRAKVLMLAVAVPILPASIISALLQSSATPTTGVDPQTGLTTFDGGDLGKVIAGQGLSLVVVVIATSLATAACYRAISTAYIGGEVTWKESLSFGFRRLLPVIGLSILFGLASYGGLIFCIAPGVLAWGLFAVSMPALLVEGHGVIGAMRRSSQLVKGTFWRVVGVMTVSTLLVGIFQAAVSAPLLFALFSVENETMILVLQVIAQVIGSVVAQPFAAALVMALYVDLRVRKEGFDLVLWAQRLGAAPPEGGFPAQPGAPTTAPVGWSPTPATVPWSDTAAPYGQPGPGYPPPSPEPPSPVDDPDHR